MDSGDAECCGGAAVTPNTPQPPPRPGTAPDTVDLVIADLIERKAMGVAKYGMPHRAGNGRDHLVDLAQELMDALVYLRAEIEDRKEAHVCRGCGAVDLRRRQP